MKTSTLLKLAEKYLWDGKDWKTTKMAALCIAIDRASYQHESPEALRTARRAKIAIRKALGRHLYYSGWAVKRGYLPMDWENAAWFWFPVIQSNRLNWLRELQRQFKEKGD